MTKKIRIGTRGSKLALVQAGMVADQITTHNPNLEIEIITIKTSGDWNPADGEKSLCDTDGGKGLFAKEIEKAILEGFVDCGVHSMKDMPSFLPDGLVINHVLPRAEPRDAFLSNDYKSINDLPAGATVGTCSPRRRSVLLYRRPDLNIVPIRGNVQTRIQKLRDGQVDATILAIAGLDRLGLNHEIASVIESDEMLPAAGQGMIGIETRADDNDLHDSLAPLNCQDSFLSISAERGALQALDGSCHTPIGAYAICSNETLTLHIMVAAEDGSDMIETQVSGQIKTAEQARKLGYDTAMELKQKVPAHWLT